MGAALPPVTLSGLGLTDLARQLDFTTKHQSAIETAGALPASLGSMLSLALFSHAGVVDASGAAITADGTAVATWTDTRSGGFSGTQATSAARPTWIKCAYGSMPALRFYGSQSLSIADNVALRPDSGAFRVFAVMRNGSAQTSSAAFLVEKGNTISSNVGWGMIADYAFPTRSQYVRVCGAGTTKASQGFAGLTSTLNVIEMALDGSTITGYMNGVNTGWVSGGEVATGNTYTAPISNTDALVLGSGCQVDLFALLVFKGTMTTDQVALVRNYLQTLYPAVAPKAINYTTSTEQTLWTAGVESAVPRQPAISRANSGNILAFAQGQSNASDSGQISILMRKSTDGGKTWSASRSIAGDGVNCFRDPTPIINRSTGRLHLLYCWNLAADTQATIMAGTSTDTARCYHIYSDNEGTTWSSAVEITSSVRLATTNRWFQCGPGNFEQLASGRLLIGAHSSDPAYSTATPYRSYFIYSDDDGATWHTGASVATDGTNECRLVQRADGSVYFIARNEQGAGRVWVGVSTDNGATFSAAPALNPELTMNPTNPGLAIYGNTLVLSHPATVGTRDHLTVYVSTDNGASWPASTLIDAGSGGYSDILNLGGGTFALMREKGSVSSINIVFNTFTLAYPAF